MQQIDFKSVQNFSGTEYNDGDIVLIDDITKVDADDFNIILDNSLDDKNHSMGKKVNMVLMVFCLQGKANITINEKNLKINRNDVLIIAPDNFIHKNSFSKDFNAKVIGFSLSAIDSEIYISKNVWQSLYYIWRNPVIHLKNDNLQIMYHYYHIAQAKLNNSQHIYHKEIMHSLLLCLIYEFLMITQPFALKEVAFEHAEIRQADVLFKHFVELLAKEKGMIRSVSEAADRLNVTGKYLSSAVKQSCGKNALEIIHHYTIQEAIRRLKYSDKSIQEISNEMNFPSISFFGKFFKNQMGVSPKQYRKQNANQ